MPGSLPTLRAILYHESSVYLIPKNGDLLALPMNPLLELMIIKCLDAGMEDYISKPVSTESLKEPLEKWIGKENDDLHQQLKCYNCKLIQENERKISCTEW